MADPPSGDAVREELGGAERADEVGEGGAEDEESPVATVLVDQRPQDREQVVAT